MLFVCLSMGRLIFQIETLGAGNALLFNPGAASLENSIKIGDRHHVMR